MKLSDDLLAKQKAVHEALKDNFNTALSMQLLVELVTSANIYLSNNTERKGSHHS
jgi:cysteinyl-tRNA synthetase